MVPFAAMPKPLQAVIPALTAALVAAVGACSSSDSSSSPSTSSGADANDSDLSAGPDATVDLARFVNPLIGTKGGETWPGADTPFGMVQWSPEGTKGNQTRTPRPGGYSYDFTKTRGFSLTHMSGTGCAGAFGDIPFLPY